MCSYHCPLDMGLVYVQSAIVFVFLGLFFLQSAIVLLLRIHFLCRHHSWHITGPFFLCHRGCLTVSCLDRGRPICASCCYDTAAGRLCCVLREMKWRSVLCHPVFHFPAYSHSIQRACHSTIGGGCMTAVSNSIWY